MDDWDTSRIMAMVWDTAELLYPDNLVEQAVYINKCYSSLCQLIDEDSSRAF